MPASSKLIAKLENKTIKKRELDTLFGQLGFAVFGGKGSHQVWGRKDLQDLHIVIATHTKEVPLYQIDQIERSLKKRGLI